MTRRLWQIALLGVAVLGPTAAHGQSGLPADAPAIRLGGSVRTLGAAVRGPAAATAVPASTGGFDQTLLRLVADGRPGPRIAWELHLVQSYTYSSLSPAPTTAGGSAGPFGLAVGDTRYRALDATADWYRGRRHAAALWVDRLNVRLTFARADVTIGRQAITFGKAYFWNPLDDFLPFDARQFDRDYKAGVDAVRVDVPLGPFSGLNLVGSAGRELTPAGAYRRGGRTFAASWYGSALLGRYFTTFRGWDAAVQAGKVYGGYQVGGGVVGEVRTVEVRGEAAYLWATPGLPLPPPLGGPLIADHFSAVAGVGRRFANTLWIEVEHFHNGAGEPRNLDAAFVRFASGAALNLGREISGATCSYDLLPVLTGQLAALHSWSDGSSQIQPTLTYSVSENSDLIAGAALGIGPAPATTGGLTHLRSEFGSFPQAYFVEFKLYF